MIFANHAHVFPEDIKPVGSIDNLKRLLDDCGIDKCVCFAPFPDRFEESSRTDTPNEWLAKAIKNDPDLYGFGTVDFTKNLRDEVDRIADFGFKGIKMHPPYQEFDIDGEDAFKAKICKNGLGRSLFEYVQRMRRTSHSVSSRNNGA